MCNGDPIGDTKLRNDESYVVILNVVFSIVTKFTVRGARLTVLVCESKRSFSSTYLYAPVLELDES